MKFLVAVAGYPDLHGGFNQPFVRTRSLYYREQGADFEILNFSATEEYEIDNVKVHTLKWFKNEGYKNRYDLLICHQANLRNHYRFLLKYGNQFPKIVFFYHGHEVLKTYKVYPQPYPYMKENVFKKCLHNIYDNFKLFIWRNYIEKHYEKLWHVFVSNWMKNEFDKWVHPAPLCMEGRSFITYNCIGKVFEKEYYNASTEKPYDFLTIRAMLDKSKYCVDIVNKLAKLYPDKNFLLVGKGEFFNHYKKAANLTWLDKKLTHEEMLDVLNSAKCALMPTRTDAQGVMMCEMATFGMPVITSDIPVCHEVFESFNGVGFINNDALEQCDLSEIYKGISGEHQKDNRYFYSIVGKNELDIIEHIAKC